MSPSNTLAVSYHATVDIQRFVGHIIGQTGFGRKNVGAVIRGLRPFRLAGCFCQSVRLEKSHATRERAGSRRREVNPLVHEAETGIVELPGVRGGEPAPSPR